MPLCVCPQSNESKWPSRMFLPEVQTPEPDWRCAHTLCLSKHSKGTFETLWIDGLSQRPSSEGASVWERKQLQNVTSSNECALPNTKGVKHISVHRQWAYAANACKSCSGHNFSLLFQLFSGFHQRHRVQFIRICQTDQNRSVFD